MIMKKFLTQGLAATVALFVSSGALAATCCVTGAACCIGLLPCCW
jgi:hypothetical protein